MGAYIELRRDYGSKDVRVLVRRSKDASQSRRLLALAAVLDGHGGWKPPGSAAWTARLCGTGCIASMARARQGLNKAYSLADAMRDAVWRKKTAARLKTLMSARFTCPNDGSDWGKSKPSIGLGTAC